MQERWGRRLCWSAHILVLEVCQSSASADICTDFDIRIHNVSCGYCIQYNINKINFIIVEINTYNTYFVFSS